MSDNHVSGPGQDAPPQQAKGRNTGLIVVLILILVVGIGSGTWWVLRGGQDIADPGPTAAAPPYQPVDQPTAQVSVSESSETPRSATPTQGVSVSSSPAASTWSTEKPTLPRASTKQAAPAMPRTFGVFELRDAGTGDALVTYWTTTRNKFFIIGYQQGGSVESLTKDLKDTRVFGKITCGTGAFGGYECFTGVHGGVGRTTMGPDVTLDELAQTSKTFYEAWK
jgi:hypothetical protein